MRKMIFTLGILSLFQACTDKNTSIIEDENVQNVNLADYLTINVDDLPDYIPSYPIHYNQQVLNTDNIPNMNPITNEGATLGRVLFYDKNLSINNTISCASCHKQESGFTDTRKLSLGFDGASETGAHSMRLANARFYAGDKMFWDKRAATLEDQSTQPIQNDVEMGFDANHGGMGAVITKITELPYYPALFKLAFGSSTITEDNMQKAIAQFVRSMVSTSSAFDTGFAGVYSANAPGNNVLMNFSNYTEQQNRGKLLFIGPPGTGLGCGGCHQAPTFALDPNSRSNGLDANETTIFKTPSLKNIDLDGAFMHDGRFSSLEEVVQHYSNGIQNGTALDNRLKTPNGQPLRLNINSTDEAALVAFMKTLRDESIIQDSKFSNPFISN